MPCPVCQCNLGVDHRMCLVQLLREGKIKNVREWEEIMKKPETIFIRKVIRKIRKEE